jgi:hypothetical protein
MPTSNATLLTVPALSATYTKPFLVGSAATARILLWSLIGFPSVLRDFSAFLLLSSREALDDELVLAVENKRDAVA